MKRHVKLTSQQQQQQTLRQQTRQEAALEFATAEELLRHDALHTPVPPSIAHRLAESVAGLPPRSRSWWRRWFGG